MCCEISCTVFRHQVCAHLCFSFEGGQRWFKQSVIDVLPACFISCIVQECVAVCYRIRGPRIVNIWHFIWQKRHITQIHFSRIFVLIPLDEPLTQRHTAQIHSRDSMGREEAHVLTRSNKKKMCTPTQWTSCKFSLFTRLRACGAGCRIINRLLLSALISQGLVGDPRMPFPFSWYL